MVLDGILVLVCAGALTGVDPQTPAPSAPADRGDSFVTTLAVQTALQQGREYINKGDYKGAVAVLEGQLPSINGSAVYLALLKSAYRSYIQQLRLAKQDGEAQKYLDRLIVLDRGALLDTTLNGRPAPQPAMTRPGPIATAAGNMPSTVRLKGQAEEKPASVAITDSRPASPQLPQVASLLAQADQDFIQKRYQQALALYEKANTLDPKAALAGRERWAYCKLVCVANELNAKNTEKLDWKALEGEVRRAVEMEPKLRQSSQPVLSEIETRRSGSQARTETVLSVHHQDRNAAGWSSAETANFVVYHREAKDLAEQVAQAAENVRANMIQKWFGNGTSAWNPRCAIYLHPTANDYGRATGQYNSPGHSSIRIENNRFVLRRIDLHCDDAGMVEAVLPHETTHIVIASQLGEQLVERLPRWADEGMAVLTEPKAKINKHLSSLAQGQPQLFRVRELMELCNYPEDSRRIGTFYAQSVSLVEFLTAQKGPQVFVRFLEDSLRGGYENALQKHFQIAGYQELEDRWTIYMIGEKALSARMTGGK